MLTHSFKVFCIGLSFLNASIVFAQSVCTAESEIIQIAKNSLPVFLEKIPIGLEEQYGFKSRKEFVTATVGKPFQVFSLSPVFWGDEKLSPQQLIQPLTEWRIPVIVNGEYRALLTVAKMNDDWKVVDFGAAGLAKELEAFGGKNMVMGNEVHCILLRIFQLQCDFVIIKNYDEELSSQKIFPLQSARNISQINFEDEQSVSSLMSLIKQAIQAKQ